MIEVRIPALFPAMVLAGSVHAADVEYTQPASGDAPGGQALIENTEISAKRFGLTQEDWSRYEEVMKGEGRYHWSHLDPVWVLALYAEGDAERQRYARLAASQEYERTRKLLLFKDAYVEAFQQMYGQEPIMDLDGFRSRYQSRQWTASLHEKDNPVRSVEPLSDSGGDRMVLFISTNGCPGCDALFMELSKRQTPGVVLDLHFIGDSESNITAWAKRMGIEPADIEAGHITLNNGSAMYAKYGNPSLPAAYYFNAAKNEVLAIRETVSP